MPERLVLVSGPPGAGKTTLAPSLAAALGMPLLMKDAIKEAIHDGLGRRPLTLEESQALGGSAFEVMWTIARSAPEVVLEANFNSRHEWQLRELRALHPSPLEVFCRCTPTVAAERYNTRHRRADRHPVHVLQEIAVEVVAAFQPLHLGPVVEVDTTQPVDVEALAVEVAALMRSGDGS